MSILAYLISQGQVIEQVWNRRFIKSVGNLRTGIIEVDNERLFIRENSFLKVIFFSLARL